jgi:hypothetical protein
MDLLIPLLALSVSPAPQAVATPVAPRAGEPVAVTATGLQPGRIYAVRAVAVGGASVTDCVERRAVAARADRRGRLRAVLSPMPPARRGASAHDFADAWCPQTYRVTLRLGGERRPAASVRFHVATAEASA